MACAQTICTCLNGHTPLLTCFWRVRLCIYMYLYALLQPHWYHASFPVFLPSTAVTMTMTTSQTTWQSTRCEMTSDSDRWQKGLESGTQHELKSGVSPDLKGKFFYLFLSIFTILITTNDTASRVAAHLCHLHAPTPPTSQWDSLVCVFDLYSHQQTTVTLMVSFLFVSFHFYYTNHN